MTLLFREYYRPLVRVGILDCEPFSFELLREKLRLLREADIAVLTADPKFEGIPYVIS